MDKSKTVGNEIITHGQDDESHILFKTYTSGVNKYNRISNEKNLLVDKLDKMIIRQKKWLHKFHHKCDAVEEQVEQQRRDIIYKLEHWDAVVENELT